MIRLAGLLEVDAIWPHIAEGMKECCRRSGGDITPDWLFMQCRKGDALLFIVTEGDALLAAMVCTSGQWGSSRVLRIVGATGWAIDRWIDELTEYREWVDRLGFSKVVFEGRAGWQRVIPKARVLRQVYEVDLGDGR